MSGQECPGGATSGCGRGHTERKSHLVIWGNAGWFMGARGHESPAFAHLSLFFSP